MLAVKHKNIKISKYNTSFTFKTNLTDIEIKLNDEIILFKEPNKDFDSGEIVSINEKGLEIVDCLNLQLFYEWDLINDICTLSELDDDINE